MNTNPKLVLTLSICAGLCLLTPLQAQSQRMPKSNPPHPALPAVEVPGALGVNIHFTDARDGELEMMEAGGFRLARMDFAWDGTEKVKGTYDFSAYDRLVKGLEPHHIQPLFILDYSNPLYDEGLSPYSDAGRTAFANWAGAAAAHFKGHRVLWEMYNEPNGGFWKPSADVQSYIKLALATGTAIERDAPGECYIGPGVSGVDFGFMEACFKAGLLKMWDAVSVHPYRQNNPESVGDEYRRLRLLIERYKPQGKTIPILSGEWGYSSAWQDYTDDLQGKYLPRQWLTNLMNGIPVSIWYDWHNDSPDPKDSESNFGTTQNAYFAGRTPVYDPKPSYTAARTLTQFLGGFRFDRRLALDSPNDYLLVFARNVPPLNGIYDGTKIFSVRLAAWTVGAPHDITIPASAGEFKVVNYLGEAQPDGIATAQGLKIRISDTPLYLKMTQSNALLSSVVMSMPNVPLDTLVTAPTKIRQGRTGAQISITRDSPPTEIRQTDTINSLKVEQVTQVIVANPLSLAIEPPLRNGLEVRLENPAEAKTTGQVSLNGGPAQKVDFTDQEKTLTFPMPAHNADGSWDARVRFSGQTQGDIVESNSHFVPIAGFAALTPDNLATSLAAHPDGDPAIASDQTLSVVPGAPDPAPTTGPVLKLAYRFSPGWKFANIQPVTPALAKIDGQPKQLGMWVYGDNSGQVLCMRFSDTTGQTFQTGGTPINWKGWRYYAFPIDPASFHWGGPNDGQFHGALKIESLFIVDSAGRKGGQGEIYVASPTWVY